jgi:hypothetical protein
MIARIACGRINSFRIRQNRARSNQDRTRKAAIMVLKPCRECGEQVSTEAVTCPNCGIKSPARKPLGCLGGVAAAFEVILIIGAIHSADQPATKQSTTDFGREIEKNRSL